MEASEPDAYNRIMANLQKLVKLTKCTDLLLAGLLGKRILSESEFDRIHAKDTSEAQATELYTTLFTKRGAFATLLRLLDETCQTGVLDILQDPRDEELSSNSAGSRRKLGNLFMDCDTTKRKSLKFITTPEGVPEFLETANENAALVLTTRDVTLTIEKIETLLREPATLWKPTEEEILSEQCTPTESARFLIVHCKSNLVQVLNKVLVHPIKAILVAESVSHAERTKIAFLSDVIISQDVQKWPDLSLLTQTKILSKQIFGEITVATLVSLGREAGLSNECVLSEDLLLPLIRGNLPNIFEHLLPDPIKYYLPRQISPRHSLSQRIFGEDTESVFVFSFPKTMSDTAKKEQLSKFVRHQRICTSTRQLGLWGERSARYIILDLKTDFEKLCSRTTQPVHWVHFTGSSLRWIKSRGRMRDVQGAVEANSKPTLSEDRFINYVEKNEITDKSFIPVCISDSPGMGKSILLAQIARQLSAKYPNRVVLFIAMTRLVCVLKDVSTSTKPNEVELIKALLLLSSSKMEQSQGHLPSIQEILLKEILEKGNSEQGDHVSVKVELLLDGFDELVAEDSQLGHECLRAFLTHFSKSTRLWLTTRPHLMEELEDSLETLGHNIVAFNKDDQELFLSTYWSLQPVDLKLNEDRLKDFARECLTKLNLKLGNTEKEFAGIPLQCLLIAQVFQEDAQNYSREGNLMSNDDILIEYEYSLITLYQEVIKRKVQILTKTRHAYYDLDERNFMNTLIYLSVCLIFPEWAAHFEDKLRIQNSASAIEAAIHGGIIESRSTIRNLNFLHRTFAEYLIATFIADSLQQQDVHHNDKFITFLTQDALACCEKSRLVRLELPYHNTISVYNERFQHLVLCYFVNEHLENWEDEGYMENLGENIGVSLFRKKKIARCCVRDSFVKILNVVEKLFCGEHHGQTEIWDTRLVYSSVFWSSERGIEAVCNKFNEVHGKEVTSLVIERVTLLHLAVVYRGISIAELLVKCHGFGECIERFQPEIRDLLAFCCWRYRSWGKYYRDTKLKMLDFFMNMSQRFIEENEGIHAVNEEAVDMGVELLIKLIECGADVLVHDGHYSILTLQSWENSEEYGRLIQSIPLEKLSKLLKVKTPTFIDEPLHHAVGICADEKTFLRLKMAGADLNSAKFFKEDTILHYAVRSKATLECIKTLVNLGSDWELKDARGGTLLHLAAQFHHPACIKYFVELGLNINQQDKRGFTPLDYALDVIKQTWYPENDGHSTNYILVLREITQIGGVFNAKCPCLLTITFWKAIRDNNMELLELITLFPNLIKECGCDGDNPLKGLFRMLLVGETPSDSFTLEATQILLDSGVDINAKSSWRGNLCSPLELALLVNPTAFRASHFKVWAQHGGIDSPAALNCLMICLLTSNVEFSWMEFRDAVRKLEEKVPRFNFKMSDQTGNTLLHYATKSGNTHGAQYLIKKGVDVNSRNIKGQTPLFFVCNCNDCLSEDKSLSITKLLFEHNVDITTQDGDERRAFEARISIRYHFSTAKLFVERSVEKIDNDWDFIEALAFFALTKGDLKTIKYFYSGYASRTGKTLSNICWKKFGYKSVLHIMEARMHGRNVEMTLEITDFLLQLDDVRLSLFQPETMDLVHVWIANTEMMDGRNVEIRRRILDKMLKINKRLCNSWDSEGRAPLFAPHPHHKPLITLIEHGADLSVRDACGHSFIDLVLNELTFTELLHGLSERALQQVLSIRGLIGRSLLHIVLLNQGGEITEEILQLLQDHGFDFNSVDDNGETALFYVSGNKETGRYLLEFGCDPAVQNSKGLTVLHLATQFNDKELVDLLVPQGSGATFENATNSPLNYVQMEGVSADGSETASSETDSSDSTERFRLRHLDGHACLNELMRKSKFESSGERFVPEDYKQPETRSTNQPIGADKSILDFYVSSKSGDGWWASEAPWWIHESVNASKYCKHEQIPS